MAISYYVAGNTATGRVNVLHSNVKECEDIVILDHSSPEVKSMIIRDWLQQWKRRQSSIETIESVEGKPFVDGAVFPMEKKAVVSNTIYDDSVNNTHTIDLSSYILETDSRRMLVNEYEERMNERIEKATKAFATGLHIHDALEHVYIQHMDFSKADVVAADWIEKYIPFSEGQMKKGQIKKRLFGTNTAEGAVNVVPLLIQPFTTVHHVKGRAGTGKSHFMNTIAEACLTEGYDIEQYICSFDPESTDMLMIRDLDLCIFDSTEPHAFTPHAEDIVIDLYEQTVTPGTDERYKEEIEQTTKEYKSYMKQGIIELKHAREEQAFIDILYRDVFTKDVMEAIRETMKQKFNE